MFWHGGHFIALVNVSNLVILLFFGDFQGGVFPSILKIRGELLGVLNVVTTLGREVLLSRSTNKVWDMSSG